MSFESLQVRPGRQVRLPHLDPADTSIFRGGKGRAERSIPARRQELDRLQELLFADGRWGVLVVLQGMDTAGKDATIRHVFEGVNPQGVRVAPFKTPTPEERAHDFLWRIHAQTPGKGEIVIFNRSQYEDVLIARVHHLVPRSIWSKRFGAINDFERELYGEGCRILKFFLHISQKEQAVRLRERIQDSSKQWKLTASDVLERSYWPRYMEAYEEMLQKTSTAWAPWYVVPSDHKWLRNLVVLTVLIETLRGLGLRYPPPAVDLSSIKIE